MPKPIIQIVSAAALALCFALPAAAQDGGISLDMGLGAVVKPTYQGADDYKTGPWVILRQGGSQVKQGFSIVPSVGWERARDSGDDAALAGMPDIDATIELGGRVNYGMGPVTAYGAVRKGLNGHEGVVGEIGAKYRTDLSDRLSLTSGIELDYADGDYMDTYFGVTAGQATPSRPQYSAGGGLKSATARIEARYAITDNTSVLGQVEYGRLLGDAADSPLVQDRDQAAVKLGIVRNFSFGF